MDSYTQDAFYRTGDMAKVVDGRIQIVGRVKEQINRAGEKIMPSKVEEFLLKIENVMEAAVIGVSDEELGSKICAFVVSSDKSITLKGIRKELDKSGLAQYKQPD